MLVPHDRAFVDAVARSPCDHERLEPLGDRRDVDSSDDEVADEEALGLIGANDEGVSVHVKEDGGRRERDSLVAVDECVVAGKALQECRSLLRKRRIVAGTGAREHTLQKSTAPACSPGAAVTPSTESADAPAGTAGA